MSDGAFVSIKSYAESRGIPRKTLADTYLKFPEKYGIRFGYDAERRKKGEPCIRPEILDSEWFNDFKIKQAAKGILYIPKAEETSEPGSEAVEVETVPAVVPPAMSGAVQGDLFGNQFDFKDGPINYSEAQRVYIANQARKAKMEADVMEGRLVEREAVAKQLTVAGIEVRKEVERLPQKCVDVIRAAKSRQEAMLAMEDIVRNMLDGLPTIIENAIKNKEQ